METAAKEISGVEALQLVVELARENTLSASQTDGDEALEAEAQKQSAALDKVQGLIENLNGLEASKLFFAELLESVETLTGIVEQYGPRGARTLVDLMFLQNAIAKGTFVDHYPGESAVMDIVKLLPSADRWSRYVSVWEPEA